MNKNESKNTFDPDKFIKEGSILNSSKLFKFYQLLDNQKATNNNIPASDDDDVDGEREGDGDEQKKHLAELKKHLENIFSKWDSICKSTDDYKIKCYEYLKYWLYGKIAEKKLNFFRIRELNEYLNKLIKEEPSIINEDCTKNFIKCAPIEVLHNKKILYDFLEYYIYLNDELSKIDENVKGKYCKYITHIFELYHKLYEEDRQWGLTHRYENELKLFRTIFEKENALSSLKSKCNIDNLLIKSFKDVRTTDMLEEDHFRGRTTSNRYDNNFTNIKSEYENIIEELPSSKIYVKLSEGASDTEYKSNHCDNLNVDKDQMKEICKKMARNIKTLPNNSEMNGLNHRDRCTYLNFWIYREISKLYPNEDKNLTDITDVYNLIDANIKINMDLIKYYSNTKNDQTAQSTLGTSSQSAPAFVKHHELSKHEPCYFNYDCTFSECREMKHLYEYFKTYDKIKGNIKCVKAENDKYFKYIKYISFLYNKHKNEKGCCSWGAEICPDYFLSCDEYYNPNKIVTAIESSDIETCNNIKNSSTPNVYAETSIIKPEDENNMYIKYFTCSYVTHPKFGKKGLRCQQPEYSSLRKNKFAAVRPVYKAQTGNSELRGKKLTINGKSINAVLISDSNAKIAEKYGAGNSMPAYNYTLFPEIRGAARKAYVKQSAEACKNGEIKAGMEEYCRKSKQYNDIINGAKLQPEKRIEVNDTQNSENIDAPANETSFLNDILQQLPVRMGAVSLASLGAVTMLFMYYKFTPFGSWLRNTIGGKKKMKHGNDIEPRISVNYQQDHMPQISQKKRIKIAYQSS
ncbi:VIR protein [Plasmodium vivax]|uniref:VIR protein n=1 Tax=Plasmodium vivax TaxID=5855 RepID=A0A1G4E6A8_PLAVI|nr:VIR protein [Plasmodium vivax]